MKSGMRIQVIPGARMLWIVTTKLIAPTIDATPVRWMPRIQRSCPWPGLNCADEHGVYDVQPHCAPPSEARKLERRTSPPMTKSQYEAAFNRGKAMSRAPIMSGTR